MNKSYKSIKICRLCKSRKLIKVLDFGKVPLANALLKTKKSSNTIPRYQLQNNLCKDCGHLQLSISVNPRLMFNNYLYMTNTSNQNLKHFKNYSTTLKKKFKMLSNSNKFKKKLSILDIASNDGSFLNFFSKKKFNRLGIDPAKNLKIIAEKKGIKQITAFFSLKESRKIKKRYGQFEIISANHVCAHVENLKDFFLGVKNLLKQKGIFSFEVSYRGSVISKNTFDTIYHEHIDYHALKPLKNFIKELGLEIFDFDLIDAQGGSIRLYVSKTKNKKNVKKIQKQIKLEDQELKLYNIFTYNTFMKNVLNIKKNLNFLLNNLSKKEKIFGYGAAAKSTTLLNYFNINSKIISFVVDDNKLKINKIIPGTNIPIISSKKMKNSGVNTIVILAWNYKKNIISKCIKILGKKIKFIIPFPEVKFHND